VGSSNLSEPFRWTQATGLVLLSSTNGVAQAVSADGSTIVGSVAGSGAFIWTAAGGVQSLSAVLTTDGINLTGWALLSASAISADGQTIAGAGVDPQGQSAAWIAVIPEPSTGTLVAVAITTLAALERLRPGIRRSPQASPGVATVLAA
jgi:hypothetical protein